MFCFRRFSVALIAGLLLFLPGAPARAQYSCDVPYEVIVTLRQPSFGIPTVWDAGYTIPDTMVQFTSGVPLQGGTILAVGRKLSKDDFKPLETVFADVNRRGRALREAAYPAKEGEVPVRIMAAKNGYLVMSNMRGGSGNAQKWTRLAWYGEDIKFRHEKILSDPVFDFEGFSLLPATDGSGFVAVVHAVNRDNERDQHGLLMRFDDSGGLIWKRAYRPGIPNQIQNLIPIDEKSYLAVGRILMEDGRIAGWALKLGYDGTILWQRTYARGKYSILRNATIARQATSEGHEFILIGDARPYDNGRDAAWVMMLDPLGEVQWQRYYRRTDMALSGGWVVGDGDGRTTVALNAKADDSSEAPDHVRLLTLSPQGGLIGDEAYIAGKRAVADDFLRGWNGERIIVSKVEDTVQHEDPDDIFGPETPAEQQKPPEEELIYKGWIFVATALDPYVDPCAQQQTPR